MIFERFSAAKDQEVHRISSHLVGTGHNAAALPHFNSTSARVQNVRARHYRHPVRRAGQCNSCHPAHTDRLAREFCHVSGAGFQNAFYTAIVLAPDTISGFPQCINIFRNRRHMALWHTDGTARSRRAAAPPHKESLQIFSGISCQTSCFYRIPANAFARTVSLAFCISS